jgi:putative DNA primase/helicase
VIAAFDLDTPYESRDPGDRDEHLLTHGSKPRAPYPAGWSDLLWLSMTTKQDAARIYARLGLHPILLHGIRSDGSCTCGTDCPPRTRGKHPVAGKWQTAALDLGRLDRQLREQPLFNVGLRMGAQRDGSFLVAIDVDGPRELLEPLEAVNGALPPTLAARTGSGGLHFIYRTTAELGNRAGIVPKVDVRGRGGQIVAAPSLHYSGQRYQWVDVREPAVLP